MASNAEVTPSIEARPCSLRIAAKRRHDLKKGHIMLKRNLNPTDAGENETLSQCSRHANYDLGFLELFLAQFTLHWSYLRTR